MNLPTAFSHGASAERSGVAEAGQEDAAAVRAPELPVDYGKFVDAVRTINLYWTLSEVPP